MKSSFAGPVEWIFKWGGGRERLMHNRKREPSGRNMKFKSSELARNGSKTVNSEVNF